MGSSARNLLKHAAVPLLSRDMNRRYLAETVSRRDADAEPPWTGSRRVSARHLRFISVVNKVFRHRHWYRDMNYVSCLWDSSVLKGYFLHQIRFVRLSTNALNCLSVNGLLIRKPCTVSQPSFTNKSSAARFSTPSATTLKQRL